MDWTTVDPTGISAAGKGAIWWVPAIKNVKAPTLVEINAGFDLSKILYTWDPNGSQDKDEKHRYGYESVVESLGKTKYAPAELEYDYDPQKPAEATGEYAHYAKLAKGTKGFLVDRRGLPVGTAPAADQYVDVYPVECGVQLKASIDGKDAGAKLRIRQSVAVNGDPTLDVKIIAA